MQGLFEKAFASLFRELRTKEGSFDVLKFSFWLNPLRTYLARVHLGGATYCTKLDVLRIGAEDFNFRRIEADLRMMFKRGVHACVQE